jgi:hypothetical protein
MPQLSANPFAGYTFTEEELQAAAQFSMTQQMYIQNLISLAACEKIATQPDPSNMGVWFQKEAYLRGQIDILTYLLEAVPVPASRPSGDNAATSAGAGVNWMNWVHSSSGKSPDPSL